MKKALTMEERECLTEGCKLTVEQWREICLYLAIAPQNGLNQMFLTINRWCSPRDIKKLGALMRLPESLICVEAVTWVLRSAWFRILKDLGKEVGLDSCNSLLDLQEAYIKRCREDDGGEPAFL